jgi:hypothetical protein
MGVYAGVTDNYLTQSDQTKVADSVKKYSLWAIGKEGNPGRTPALDLNFAENKSLVDDVSGSNLVTFTRTSAATYVDSNGVIKTAGLNLLLYSNKLNQFFTSGVAYGGGYGGGWQNDPEDITELTDEYGKYYNTSYSLIWSTYGTCNTSSSTGYVISFFAKSSTTANIRPRLYSNINGTVSTGTYVSLQTGGTEYPGGWRKFEFDMPTTTNTGNSLIIELSTGTGFDIKNIQVEVGDTATVYADTTSSTSGAPRFDHDPDTGESLGLLIEESRTNSEQYSQGFTSGWNLSYAQTTTGQSDPMGGTDAILVKQTNGTSTRQFIASNTGLNYGSNAFTVSVFVKYVNYDYVIFTGRDQDGPDSRIGYLLPKLRFQFSTETIAFQESTWPGSTQTLDYGFEKYPNGWYRLWMTRNISVRTNRWGIAVQSDYSVGISDLNFVTGDNSSSVLAFGFQAEQGSFLTSYIPTSGSIVTRDPDLTSITGSNLTSWYNVSEGTLYVDYKGKVPPGATGGYFGTNVYGWGVYSNGSYITNKGRSDFSPDRGTYTISNTQVSLYRGAISQSDIVGKTSYAVNGTLYATDADRLGPYITPAGFSVSAADVGAASQTKGSFTVKRTMYWGLKLSNSTLQSLTE